MMEEEERWKAYARAKIAKGLEDVEAGRVVDGETAIKYLHKLASEKRKKRA
jgi:predicted transcriptional regulator